MKISVLIPVHNEEKMIFRCIDSCLSQTRVPDEIIAINDGSTDRTGIILAEFGDSIKVITIPIATGNKSRAQEIGLAHVTGDIVFATDGDSILDNKFFELIENDFESDPNLSVVAGYVESMQHNILTSIREIDYTLGQDLYKRAQACTNFILVIPGCAGAFKAELFHNGTINFEHDTLTEDLDFTYKLNSKRLKIKFNTKAIVYTQDPPTILSYINQMRRWYGGGWQNLSKHYRIIFISPSAAIILTPSYLEGLLFSIVFFIMPIFSLYLFVIILFLYFVTGVVIGTYAAIRKKRIDLLLASPFLVFLNILNSYIFIEQFFFEIIIKKKNMVWFHPERITSIAPNKA